MELPIINLDSEYMVITDGTSDGTQDKYFKDNIWYKTDRLGHEGEAEHLVSLLLSCSSLSQSEYVFYDRVIINGIEGCSSRNFLAHGESFVTIYRLYSNVYGGDIAQKLATYDYDDAIEFVLSFTKEQTGLDLHRYLANLLMLDRIILNEDRNFNNFGVIFDGENFRTAPFFDNGKSLFVGNKKTDLYGDFDENSKLCFAKSFSGSFELNYAYLKEYSDLSFDTQKFKELLTMEPKSRRAELLLHRLIKFQAGA
jgi:hypothetical protein